MIDIPDAFPAADGALAGFAIWWSDALLRASIQGGVAALVLYAVLRAFPRIAPPVQVWLWRLVFLKFLGAMFLPVPLAWGSEAVIPGFASAGAGRPSLTPVIILAASITGACIVCAGLWRDAAALRRLRGSADVSRDGALRLAICELAEDLRTPPPELLISSRIERPMLVGVFRPAVLLPAAPAKTCDLSAIRMVLAHELAHVRRRDLLWNWLPCLVHSLFFFHPAIWVAGRELRLTQDAACDTLALNVTHGSPAAYGRLLIEIAQRPQQAAAVTWMAAGAMADFRSLRRRLAQLARRSCSPRSPAALAVLLLVLALTPSWQMQSARGPASAYMPGSARLEHAGREPAAAPVRRVAGPAAAAAPAAPRGAHRGPRAMSDQSEREPQSSAAR